VSSWGRAGPPHDRAWHPPRWPSLRAAVRGVMLSRMADEAAKVQQYVAARLARARKAARLHRVAWWFSPWQQHEPKPKPEPEAD